MTHFRGKGEGAVKAGVALTMFFWVVKIGLMIWLFVFLFNLAVTFSNDTSKTLKENDSTVVKETGKFFANIANEFTDGMAEANEDN